VVAVQTIQSGLVDASRLFDLPRQSVSVITLTVSR
jgi:hypothetical protein